MTQPANRSHSKVLAAKLKELAEVRGCSLNQAANSPLPKGAGPADAKAPLGIGGQLDSFIGTWPEAEAEAFDQRIAEACERVEEDLWQR